MRNNWSIMLGGWTHLTPAVNSLLRVKIETNKSRCVIRYIIFFFLILRLVGNNGIEFCRSSLVTSVPIDFGSLSFRWRPTKRSFGRSSPFQFALSASSASYEGGTSSRGSLKLYLYFKWTRDEQDEKLWWQL